MASKLLLLDDHPVSSNAILRYLAHRERRYDLYPLEPAERAPVDYALDAWSTQVRPPLFPLEPALAAKDLDGGAQLLAGQGIERMHREGAA